MKLINTGTYLLLIDEEAEIKEGNRTAHLLPNDIWYTAVVTEKGAEDLNTNDKAHKAIAYYPLTKKAKELDLPLLPPFEKVDVEKIAKEQCPEWNYSTKSHLAFLKYEREGFIKGYKAAQSKQFSLEDMKKAYYMGAANCHDKCIVHNCKGVEQKVDIDKLKILCQEYIQSLSTQQLPKEFIPEIEYYDFDNRTWRNYNGAIELKNTDKRLKTISNSEGKETIVGTYKY